MEEDLDILGHMRAVAREIKAQHTRSRRIVAIRRILVAISDILDVYLNFQRDKRWDDRDW